MEASNSIENQTVKTSSYSIGDLVVTKVRLAVHPRFNNSKLYLALLARLRSLGDAENEECQQEESNT